MRRRVTAWLAVMLVAGVFLAPIAQASELVLAQETGEDSGGNVDESDAGGEETAGTSQDEGAGEEAAESGAGGESGGATEETGPPWTFQMARLTLVLLFLWGLVTVIQYYRMVVQRSRGRA